MTDDLNLLADLSMAGERDRRLERYLARGAGSDGEVAGALRHDDR